MRLTTLIIFNFVFSLTSNFLFNYSVSAQSNCVCASCGRACGSGHATSCSYYVAPKTTTSSSKPVVITPANNLNMMVAGTLMQGLLNGIFSSDQKAQQQKQQQQQLLLQQQQIKLAQEQAKQKKIKDSADHAMFLKLMDSYKPVEGSQKLDFKNLNGDMETMSKNAREQFDGLTVPNDTSKIGHQTNFFGTQMDSAQINTLVDPDKDSVILDINNADKFIKENKILDSAKVANLKNDTAKKTILNSAKTNIECETLQKRLDNYFMQRDKFHKTIISTQTDLEEWKKKNNSALWNAAQSGFEFVFSQKFGDLLKTVEDKGAKARNIEQRLLPYMDQLREKGVDVDGYLKTLRARTFNSDFLAKDVKKFGDAIEYDAFFRDAVQAGIAKVADTDTDYEKILKDPNVEMVLNDGHPLVDVGQFIASKGIEKILETEFLKNLITFNNKIPYVAYAQLAVDEAYNALDWYLSYKQIKQLHEVSGQELQATMNLQMNIDKTFSLLKNCNH